MIRFFDTTLRDGEQTPGAHLSRAHKRELARALARLGVDVIEAGFPASSPGNLQAVKDICGELRAMYKDTPEEAPIVAALARASRPDIDAAAEAIAGALRGRIHVFIAASDLHLEHKLRMTRGEVLERIDDCVAYAAGLCADVEFSAEDATRADPDFLLACVSHALDAGATTINIPDTVGYALPDEYGALIARVVREVSGRAVVSAHCHDDLGLAAANTMAAIRSGAKQAEVTVNGLGERAGNAALEETVMTLFTRAETLGEACRCRIDTTRLTDVSRMVASLTGVSVPPNKAVVGANAFAHEAGIHQHGVLCDRRTYEIMTPESVGATVTRLPLGRLSGSHAFAERVAQLGYQLDEAGIRACFERFKSFSDKKALDDEDIRAIVGEYLDGLEAVYRLEGFQIQAGSSVKSMAMVMLSCRGTSLSEAALGDGPIDAAFNAVGRLSGATDIVLEEYGIRAVTEGNDALGEARVRLTIDGTSYTGRAVSTDIIEASVKSYVNALNKWANLSVSGS